MMRLFGNNWNDHGYYPMIMEIPTVPMLMYHIPITFTFWDTNVSNTKILLKYLTIQYY
jgi:hypothetical protein